MSEGQPPEEPFDPYRPPPPGQPPYGQQPPPYGTPPGHRHVYPQGPGQYPAYDPPPPRSSRPLWLGALLGLVLVGLLFWLGLSMPDLIQWVVLAAVVAVVVLIVVPATRRWGLGLLIGAVLSLPVGLIIFAGVCLVLIASYSQGGT